MKKKLKKRREYNNAGEKRFTAKRITKDSFINQITMLLELYGRTSCSRRSERILERLEDAFALEEFWITEWIFCQYRGEPFVFVEELPSGDGQMRYVENASELYDFILELIAEQERGIFVYRYGV